MGVEVRILGPLELVIDGDPVELRSGTQRAVLAALAVDAGRVVSPEAVADVVWGDAAPPSARASLQAHLSRLRRILTERGATDVIVTRPEGYRLDAEVDVSMLEGAVTAARGALEDGDAEAAAGVLRDALAAWRGTPLGDVADHPSIESARRRLEALRLDATELWLRAEVAAGNDVVTDLEAFVAEQPLRETGWALLMRGLARVGREAEALAAYERARAMYAGELGVGPGPELRRLHGELLRADADADAAPPPSNLPTPLTSFVGRRDDLERLVGLVGTRRLVTITGIGGAGKTRLAVETARTAAEGFPDGVWFVDLTVAADPEQVLGAVAAAAGVREAPGEPLEGRLVTVLRDARSLLVLDNCEHVVEACAALTDRLLRGCPRLTVLATSREPLDIPGEVLHELAGLPLEGAEPAALRLLAERTADVATDLELDAPAAADVCRQLDGLPLAIEIVAPHLRTLSLEEVARRLEGRFRLLASGSRVAPARHRTLEGAIAWSCELITAGERELLGRLSVFPGSFARDAVEAVCHDAALLDRLVGRSLVSAEGGGRFRLLETVRAYAREHLAPDEPLRERLADWTRALAVAAEPELTGRDQATWLDRLDADQDNLRVGLEVAAERGEVAEVAVPLLLFWAIRGRMIEGEAWLARAVADSPPGDPARLRALNAWALALESVQGPSPELTEVLDEAAALADDLGDAHGAAWAACWSGLVAMWRDLDSSRAQLDRAARGFSAVEDAWGHGLALLYLGHVARLQSDLDGAEAHLRRAAEVFPDRWGAAMCRSSLGELARYRGDHPTARALLGDALATFTELDSPEPALVCLKRLARLAHDDGDLDEARTLHLRALDLARRAGSATLIPETLVELAQVAWDAGEPVAAVGWLDEVARLPITGGSAADGLDLLAAASAAIGDPEAAVLEHAAAAAVRERLGVQPRPDRQERLTAAYAALRDELGAAAFDRAWAEGSGAQPDAVLRAGLAAVRSTLRELSPSGDAPRPPGTAGTG